MKATYINNNIIHVDNKDKYFVYDNKSKKYVSYETDIRLLKRLLMGPQYAHWNNAEIGSHLKFFRRPNIFERDIYNSMCYFHC